MPNTDLSNKWAGIGLNRDYSGLDLHGLQTDIQGWESYHSVFPYVINTFKPQLVIEVGTWKGASVINMCNLSRQAGIETNFICIDTWLGSNSSLWLQPEYRESLMLAGGYPTMYRQFIRNIIDANVADMIYPLPMTSTSASDLLNAMDIQADAIYIDAGHEEDEVTMDLKRYYELLKPNGVLFGDDYTSAWPGVVAAVDKFSSERRLKLLTQSGKYLFVKEPGSQAR